jgi:hypothetical protein
MALRASLAKIRCEQPPSTIQLYPYLEQRHRVVKAPQRRIINRRELEALARAEVSDDARDEQLPGFGAVGDARRAPIPERPPDKS